MRSFYTHYQRNYQTCDKYLDNFNNLKDVIKQCGGNVTSHDLLTRYSRKQKGITNPSSDKRKVAKSKSKEAYKAMEFLCGLSREQYGDLLDQLANSFLAGHDAYSKMVVSAYNLVTNWKGSNKIPSFRTNNGVSFNTMGKEDQDKNTTNKELDGLLKIRSRKVVKCFICGGNHYANRCKHKNSNEDNQDSTNTTMSNKDNGTVSGETTIASSSNNTLSGGQTTASASINVTASQGEDESWDQNVDYSGLVFLHNTSSCNEKPEEL